MKPSNLTHWCLLHLPTLPSFQKNSLSTLFILFCILFLLTYLTYSVTDLLTYLLTDLVTYLLTCLVPRKQLHLVQKIYFGRKIVTSPHFTQPNVEKNPFLPPKKQFFEKKREKRKPQPFIPRNPFEEIKK